jgi:hypothetical protein
MLARMAQADGYLCDDVARVFVHDDLQIFAEVDEYDMVMLRPYPISSSSPW